MLPASSSNEMHYSGPEREKLQHIIVKLGIREERIMLPRSRTTRAERNGSAVSHGKPGSICVRDRYQAKSARFTEHSGPGRIIEHAQR
jgi:hypothetical protein